jgi:hypothetical protein
MAEVRLLPLLLIFRCDARGESVLLNTAARRRRMAAEAFRVKCSLNVWFGYFRLVFHVMSDFAPKHNWMENSCYNKQCSVINFVRVDTGHKIECYTSAPCL